MSLYLQKTAKFAVISPAGAETNKDVKIPSKVSTLVASLGLVPHPEGGFFLETWRTGTEPMTTRGQTEVNVSKESLVETDRGHRSPDGESRRNCISSIFWVPTAASPTLILGVNLSGTKFEQINEPVR
jgi:hypothetical protein